MAIPLQKSKDHNDKYVPFVSGGGGNTAAQITRTGQVYTVTNPVVDRSLEVTIPVLTEIAAVLGTLIADLKASGIIS